MHRKALSLPSFVLIFLGIVFFGTIYSTAHADSASDAVIQSQIDAHNQQITSIQNEIAAYQAQLTQLGSQKQSLQTSLTSIDVNRKKTAAQIAVIQNQIASATLALKALGGQIVAKQSEISLDKQALAQSIRQIANSDQLLVIPTLFASDNFVDAWREIDTQMQLGEALQSHMHNLTHVTAQLADQQAQVDSTKNQLSTFNQSLVTQKGALDATAQAKTELLQQTKSQQTKHSLHKRKLSRKNSKANSLVCRTV